MAPKKRGEPNVLRPPPWCRGRRHFRPHPQGPAFTKEARRAQRQRSLRSLTTAGSVSPIFLPWIVTPDSCDSMSMRVALTVDAEHPDHPTSEPLQNAERTLSLLQSRGVVATFFVQSSWAMAFTSLFHRIVGDGHLIGCHSHWHCPYTSMTSEGIRGDLTDARRILNELGHDPGDWFRLPGGHGYDVPEILDVVGECGFQHVGWTKICGDWERGMTADRVVADILSDVDRRRADGLSVIVVHSWPDPTPYALERVLDGLAGTVEYVRLDQLSFDEIPRNG